MNFLITLALFFSSLCYIHAQTVTDIDGNVYQVVTIGSQKWMKSNLNVSRFSNGDPIPNITDSAQWVKRIDSIARCYYTNDSVKYAVPYGALYNAQTVIDPRNICPSGWHVPSKDEWLTLQEFLGGQTVAGTKLKDTLLLYWKNTLKSDNASGFTAVANGLRRYNGSFGYLGDEAFWWCSGPEQLMMTYWAVRGGSSTLYNLVINRLDGMAVRCVEGAPSYIAEFRITRKPVAAHVVVTSDKLIINKSHGVEMIKIVTISGKEMVRFTDDNLLNTLNLSTLSSGTYILYAISKDAIVQTYIFVKY